MADWSDATTTGKELALVAWPSVIATKFPDLTTPTWIASRGAGAPPLEQ